MKHRLLWSQSVAVSILVSCSLGILCGASSTTPNQQQQQAKAKRKLSVDIVDATKDFFPSTESTYDHEVTLIDNLSFHWNDVVGDSFSGRLIHKADSMDQAPGWLGFGIYHSNHNYTTLPTQNFMVGSTAFVGLPTQADVPIPALHYHLADKFIDSISQVNDDPTVTNAVVLQHDSDDGQVVTDLSFTKTVASATSASTLRRQGTNVFIWAVGAPGVGGRFSQHAFKGVIYLDFAAVQQQVEGGSTIGGTSTAPADGGSTQAASDTSGSSSGGGGGGNTVNTSPIIRGKCGSSILDGADAGQVPLTPTLNFHWTLLGAKIQIALEYTGREAWLGVASSPNGNMVGSSAIIGVPGDTPKHYLLNDQDVTGVVEDASVTLEGASIASVPSANDPSTFTTTLKYTKLLNDPNDPVPITGGSLNTFLFAVGNDVELGYHEHRGSFRINLEECGGIISENAGGVWTHHGLFATHGFFAVLGWALLTPFAITVAWFRTLVPASWIYIHVFSNVFTMVLTMLTFVLALIGVSKEDEADHFTHTHHWVGMFLFFLASFQVINGFLRPPVERKDARPLPPQDTFLGILPVPRTPRETWQTMHRLTGMTALILGIYQIQSGLKLYSQRFQTAAIVKYYWIYVVIFFGSLIALKVWVVVEEGKARQGVMEAVSTQEPMGPGDDVQGMGGRTTSSSQMPLPPELPGIGSTTQSSQLPLPPEFPAALT